MRSVMLMGLAILLAGAYALPASAQGCYVCDDEFWTEVQCASAEWTAQGWSECNDWGSNDCELSGSPCWGPDPEEDQFALLSVSSSGSVLPPSATDVLLPEEIGLTPWTALTERTCKGFISRRVYGARARSELRAQAAHIVI